MTACVRKINATIGTGVIVRRNGSGTRNTKSTSTDKGIGTLGYSRGRTKASAQTQSSAANSAAYRWDNRDLSLVRHRCCEASGVANVLLANENVDVLAHLTLLIEDSIAHAGV